ncbi:hypothetical protein SDC9_95801 [bioreactor metagenome]|uniref:Uncharacterized protein n=1 Tax=bioreactor metagenome TaxID=1076179 RepID=A0A645AE09_9ZZZZ
MEKFPVMTRCGVAIRRINAILGKRPVTTAAAADNPIMDDDEYGNAGNPTG